MSLRFGDYEVETLLGPGGVTETYRAHRESQPQQPVALKLLRPDRGGGTEKIANAFTNLGLRNGELRVPGLARVLEVSAEPGQSFVITELVAGVDLETLWNNAASSGTIDYNLVAIIGTQVARVLSSLHERKDPSIHGGLSPGNVLVTPEGNVVLTDVGFSAALRNLTEFPIDKWWYVAPELLLTKMKPTPRSDLYSLGAVLYFLLSGEAPVMGDTRNELAEQIEDAPPPIAGIPGWLELAINNLLSKNPDDRPRSAAAAALQLTPPQTLGNQLSGLVAGPAPYAPPKPVPATAAPAPAPAPMPGSPRPAARGPGAPALFASAGSSAAGADALPELDVLPSLDLLDGPVGDGLPLAVMPPARGAIAPSMPSLEMPAPDLDVPSFKPLTANPSAHPVIDTSEPDWVDDLAPQGPAKRGKSKVDDDFFDLPSTAQKNFLSAGMTDDGSHTMDLPELPDAGPDAAPKVLDLPMLGAVSQTISIAPRPSRSDQESDEDRRMGGPIDPDQVGMVEYSEEDDDDAVRPGTKKSGTGGSIVVLPRRAGSARAGGPGEAKSSGGLFKVAVAIIVLAGGGYAAKEALFAETMLPAPPPRTNTPPQQVDQAAAAAAQQRAAAQDEAAAPSRGMLAIETTPRGASVWIDGVDRGRSPVKLETSPGAHRVVLTKPGFKMVREVADTSEGLTLKRTLPPATLNFGGKVALTVECKTEGKYPIFIDGRDTGLLCPIKDVIIPEGNRLIGLYVIPQNKIWSFEREVVKGSTTHRVIFSY